MMRLGIVTLQEKLFYHDPAWKYKDRFIRFLEIVIDPGRHVFKSES